MNEWDQVNNQITSRVISSHSQPVTLVDAQQTRLEFICDQTRYLLMDWLEHQKTETVTFEAYLSQWKALFEVVSEQIIRVADFPK